MESGKGKENLMKVIAILKTIQEQEKRTFDIQEMICRGKENVILLVTEHICKLKESSDQKKRCLTLLEEVLDWWDKMVEDRENLLLTIADMELEKQQQQRTNLAAKDIYRFHPLPFEIDDDEDQSSPTSKNLPRRGYSSPNSDFKN